MTPTKKQRPAPASVWLIESGSYSDYTVHAACPDKATAERVAAELNAANVDSWDDYNVTEVPLVTDVVIITTHQLSAEVWDNGTTSATRESSRTEWEGNLLYPQHRAPVGKRWVRAPIHDGKGGRLEVFGTDLERVRRVFSDTRAQLIADPGLRARKEFNR